MDSHDKEELQKVKNKLYILESQFEALKVVVANLVTRPEFTPVKLIVYGMVGSILAGVVGAILSKILIK